MALRFQAVLPKPFHADAFRAEMTDTLERMGAGMLVDFAKTTETWTEEPTFEIEMTPPNARFIEVHVFCDALRDGDRVRGTKGPQPAPVNLVYFFLNYGTDVRYAHMSKNFRPKTRVRVLGSFPGQGWLWKVDVKEPNPGIEARHWDAEIKKKYDKIAPSQLEAALRRGARGSGHAL